MAKFISNKFGYVAEMSQQEWELLRGIFSTIKDEINNSFKFSETIMISGKREDDIAKWLEQLVYFTEPPREWSCLDYSNLWNILDGLVHSHEVEQFEQPQCELANNLFQQMSL
jgi:hypothetical protein